MQQNFYDFLEDEDVSEEITQTLRELENAIYKSPRFMLTHSRIFIETILEKVMINEDISNEHYLTIIERIQDLDEEGLLTEGVRNAFHEIRKQGNHAAHDSRQFRFSESLSAWERIYTVVKWFVEVYISPDIEVPKYVDPVMKADQPYDLEEMTFRFQRLEELLKKSLTREQPKTQPKAVERKEDHQKEVKKETTIPPIETAPGLITIRMITYGDDAVEVPYFLRDAFLLPQRFEELERFLVRMHGGEQARLLSELPDSLEGFHKRVTRYSESTSEMFFKELKDFIAEEIRRRKLVRDRPGELFLFYDSSEIVVTEDLGKVEINKENFTGMPSLIDQLTADGMIIVRDLPKELLIIGKYRQVGKSKVERFFKQLQAIQEEKVAETV